MTNRIKEHRKRLGWTQEKLAALADTSVQQISRLEKSQRGLDDKWLERLGRAMGIAKADLLSDAFRVPGRASSKSDLAKDDREADIIHVWRLLSTEDQGLIIAMIKAVREWRGIPPISDDDAWPSDNGTKH